MPNTENPAEGEELPPRNRHERRAAASGKRRWMSARNTADHLDISIPSLWRGVRQGSIPAPSYPTPGTPRWDVNELDAAIAATRCLPRENLAKRRTQRLAQLAAATTKPMDGADAEPAKRTTLPRQATAASAVAPQSA